MHDFKKLQILQKITNSKIHTCNPFASLQKHITKDFKHNVFHRKKFISSNNHQPLQFQLTSLHDKQVTSVNLNFYRATFISSNANLLSNS